MDLARVALDLTVPSIGDRPPLLAFRSELRVTPLHIVLGGLISAAIVWIATQSPRRRPPVVPPGEPGDELTTARLVRA